MILKSLLFTILTFLIVGLIVGSTYGYDKLHGYVKWRWNIDITPWVIMTGIFLVTWLIFFVIVRGGGF